MIDRIRLPFQEQIEFFRKKLNLPTERWDDILKSAHDRAFVVAGAMNADLLDDLRKAVDATIAGGDTITDFRKKFKATVEKHGWHGWTGEGSKAGEAWRTRVIYQSNIATSHAAGRWQQLNDPDLLKLRPYWRYVHNDSALNPRPHHKAWGDAGLTLPHDHPFWQTHFPPNGWGCRCRVTAVKAPGENDATEPPQGWYTRNDKGQMPGIDTGWDYAPGANATTPLRELIDRKLLNLDAPIGAAMWKNLNPALAIERGLAWYDTLDFWRKTGQVGAPRTHILGALSPMVLDWLMVKRGIVPVSAEIAVQDRLILGPKENRHQVKAHDGLTDAEWRRIPEVLDAPERVLFDTHSGHLLYVLPVSDAAGQKIAVEFDYRTNKKSDLRMNMIVSAYRNRIGDIDAMVKGGVWIEVM